MIEVRNYRSNGTAKEVLLSNPLRPLEEAMRQLLISELGWGGRITKSSEAAIEVETTIMSCRDRTVFSGPPEEMRQLFAAVLLWHEADKKVSFEAWWKRVSEVTDGVPLLVKLAAPQIKKDMILEELAKVR